MNLAHFTISIAGRATDWLCAGFTAVALAGMAALIAGDLDLLFNPENGFLKCQADTAGEILSAVRGIA